MGAGAGSKRSYAEAAAATAAAAAVKAAPACKAAAAAAERTYRCVRCTHAAASRLRMDHPQPPSIQECGTLSSPNLAPVPWSKFPAQ